MHSESDKSVSKVWSDFAHARLAPGTEGWRFALDHPRVRTYVYDTYIGGSDPFGWALSNFAPNRPLFGLEIGCGGGDLAIGLARSGRFSQIDAYDVSHGAIELAREKLRKSGLSNVNFEVRDCNEISILGKKYDFVYSSHALHHIEGLEALFQQVALVLNDDGVFFADDYIGPSRMQYNEHHLTLLNEIFHKLPEEKRRDAWYDDMIKPEIIKVPIADYLRIDPSEGVRAAEIVPIMARSLFTKVFPLGMSIAYECLNGVIRNFDPNSESDNALLDQLIEADRLAANDMHVPVCFAMLVGFKHLS